MKTLRTFEFGTRAGGRGTYDWGKLLDGAIYELTAGKDFECKPETFITLARTAAKKAGKTLKVSKIDNGVVIQAVEGGAK